MTSTTESPRTLPLWRLWVPLLLQSALILAIPAQAVYTHFTGKTVVLQTAPVDPYDFLRGYYVTLNYEISGYDTLKKLPGWKELEKDPNSNRQTVRPGTRFYIVLESPKPVAGQPPQPWKPVRVSRDRPADLSENQIALQGTASYGNVQYGLETYYIPEDQRVEINQDINQAQISRNTQPIVVEVKVDTQGRAIPLSFWVSDRNYKF